MTDAYHAGSALEAEAALLALAKELDRTHPGAAASLREGLDETLDGAAPERSAHAGADGGSGLSMSLSAMPLILRCTKTDHDRSSHDISALSGSVNGQRLEFSMPCFKCGQRSVPPHAL